MKNMRYHYPALHVVNILLLFAVFCLAQTKKYKDHNVCIDTEVHKGKLNHGKSYCVAFATVREFKDGRKDTVAVWFDNGKIFVGDEYEKYNKLPERGKYIIDSLKEDGLPQLQQSYLTYEPIYMKPGKKAKWFWSIEGEKVVLYQYSIWNNSKGNGIQLLKEVAVK